MANIKSQKKRIRTNELRRQRNVAVRSKVKTFMKHADAAIATKSAADAQTEVVAAISAIDRACSKGVLPPNQAARRKSSLQQRLNRQQSTAS